MWTAAHTEGAEMDAASGSLLITGSSVRERTAVEALRLEDGLAVWWYDRRLRFEDLVCGDGMVFVSSTGWPRPGTLGPTAITAVRAEDGAAVWRIGPKQVRRQMALKPVRWGVRALWMTSCPRSAWQSAKNVELSGHTHLAAADGIVVACKESVVFALDAGTGRIRWMYPTTVAGARQLITAHGNRVYVHGNHRAFHALDARTGRVRWSCEGRLYIDRLTPSEGLVYISTLSARWQAILALRAADGRREHELALGGTERPAGVTGDGIAYLTRKGQLRAVRVARLRMSRPPMRLR